MRRLAATLLLCMCMLPGLLSAAGGEGQGQRQGQQSGKNLVFHVLFLQSLVYVPIRPLLHLFLQEVYHL